MSTHGFPYRLVVLRHGQSEWNAAGVFTGWENAHLTAQGELEAARAGALLAEHGVLPAFVHTSLQRRTIRTADLVLAAADRDWIPVRRSWRLNGRHYGALQGRNKAEVLQQYGEEQVMLWRRSYEVPPPPLDVAAASSQAADPRYHAVPPDALPGAESLADVSARLLPYWHDAIVPDLRAGGCVLVVSHGNTLRALVKHLESIPDDGIAELELPTGIPLVYRLGPDLRPDALGGQYLDRQAARDGIEAITYRHMTDPEEVRYEEQARQAEFLLWPRTRPAGRLRLEDEPRLGLAVQHLADRVVDAGQRPSLVDHPGPADDVQAEDLGQVSPGTDDRPDD